MNESASIRGHLDGFIEGCICGWAYDADNPGKFMVVDIIVNGTLYAKCEAKQFRRDLLAAGIGDGCHAFSVPYQRAVRDQEILIRAEIHLHQIELINSPQRVTKFPTTYDHKCIKVDPHNIDNFLAKLEHDRIEHFLVDTNDMCNANCIYCPNPRTKAKISRDQFATLVNRCIRSVKIFQFGCGQEPTVDNRLSDFFKILHESPLERARVAMITNGTLLHRHDLDALIGFGLSELQVSIDTIDEDVSHLTRKGINLGRVMANIISFRKRFPRVSIVFSSVIHSLNIDTFDKLLEWGDAIGVERYYIREIFRVRFGVKARHDRYDEAITKLGLKSGQFDAFEARFQSHPCRDKLFFYTKQLIESSSPQVTVDTV